MKAWLRFFRVVNLPTVPGDVLAGAAVAAAASGSPARPALPIVAASLSAVFVYLFGLRFFAEAAEHHLLLLRLVAGSGIRERLILY